MAECFALHENVIGYDLINEPFTEVDLEQHWKEVKISEPNPVEREKMLKQYGELISAVRMVDLMTPIIVEPPFWANMCALPHLPIEEIKKIPNCEPLLVSVHFYTPQTLTFRQSNGKQYKFPGIVPCYVEDGNEREIINWSETNIIDEFKRAKEWANKNDVDIFVGEFGCTRDIEGAVEYIEVGVKFLNSFFTLLALLPMFVRVNCSLCNIQSTYFPTKTEFKKSENLGPIVEYVIINLSNTRKFKINMRFKINESQ